MDTAIVYSVMSSVHSLKFSFDDESIQFSRWLLSNVIVEGLWKERSVKTAHYHRHSISGKKYQNIGLIHSKVLLVVQDIFKDHKLK